MFVEVLLPILPKKSVFLDFIRLVAGPPVESLSWFSFLFGVHYKVFLFDS